MPLDYPTTSEIFSLFIPYSILSPIVTRSKNPYDMLKIILSKKRAYMVSMNKSTRSRSSMGGSTWAARSLQHWAYSLKDSLFFLVIYFEVVSCLEPYMCCTYIASWRPFLGPSMIGSDPFSRFLYHLRDASLKLSWKQWIIILSFWECNTIFRQYIIRWPFGQLSPLYFLKYVTLNFGERVSSGTRHISITSRSSMLCTSTTFNLLSKIWYFPSDSYFSIITSGWIPWGPAVCYAIWESSKGPRCVENPTGCTSMTIKMVQVVNQMVLH